MACSDPNSLSHLCTSAVSLEAFSALREVAGELGKKQIVMLGSSTYGTHEFYQYRVEITRQLILEHGFTAIAIEGDGLSVYRVNQYIQGEGTDSSAHGALSGFTHFPLWMWRNTLMLDFIGWLREYNKDLPAHQRVGLYGLDRYNTHSAIAKVFSGFNPKITDNLSDFYECSAGDRVGQREEVVDLPVAVKEQLLVQLLSAREETVRQAVAATGKVGAQTPAANQRGAEQDAASYYKRLISCPHHAKFLMASELAERFAALHRDLASAKMAVWAHNCHVAGLQPTGEPLVSGGHSTLGVRVKALYGESSAAIALTTNGGAVTAASNWLGSTQRFHLPPALEQSCESIFNDVGYPEFYLPIVRDAASEQGRYLIRAIGPVYHQEAHPAQFYSSCRLADLFDGVIYVDRTRALEPLDPTSEWLRGEQVKSAERL